LFLSIKKTACEPDFMCEETATATTNWVTEVTICPEDEVDDMVPLKNNLFVAPGEHYAYLLTDTNEILQAVILDTIYNFEGSGLEEQRVYGIHFDGMLNPMIGQPRTQTTANGDCFTHSSSDLFLSIKKTACEPDFVCEESATATTNWVTEVTICPEDGADDMIPLKNNLFLTPGDHYAYLLTDTNEILQAVVWDTIYNFEGSGLEEQRIYGVHFERTLMAFIGQHRNQTIADGCHQHSSSDLFLSIKKDACPAYECQESLTATHNWVTEVDICSNDGLTDAVFLQNNLFIPPGTNYTFLLTDANEILQAVVTDTTYNFEGTGEAEQRIYGLNFAGELLPKIGEHRRNTTATECFIHSGDNLFIRINKTAACVTNTFDEALASQVRLFPNPVQDLLNVELPTGFHPERIEVFDLFGSQKLTLPVSNSNIQEINVSQFSAGTYWLRMSNTEHFVTKRIIVTK
ncbi:MAG: T9SS type A sorting domain-containing protein, partial [Bacteroidota bacterium]